MNSGCRLSGVREETMPLPSTSEEFLELVKKSKVIDDSRLTACVANLPHQRPYRPIR